MDLLTLETQLGLVVGAGKRCLGYFFIVGICSYLYVVVASTRMRYSIHPRQTGVTRIGGREPG